MPLAAAPEVVSAVALMVTTAARARAPNIDRKMLRMMVLLRVAVRAPIALTCDERRRGPSIAMCWRAPKKPSAVNERSDSVKFSSFVTRVTTRVPTVRDARHNNCGRGNPRPVEVIGTLLEDEAAALHEGMWDRGET